jgi:hypothetical protein
VKRGENVTNQQQLAISDENPIEFEPIELLKFIQSISQLVG